MSKFGCVCGHIIVDQRDHLPYKAYIREEEDMQKPIELLADILARYYEAHQQGQGDEFVREYELSRGDTWNASYLQDKPLREVLFSLIFPFWNHYDRSIYECEQCGRLWVDAGTAGKPFGLRLAPYKPEGDTRHILWSRHNHNPYGYLDE